MSIAKKKTPKATKDLPQEKKYSSQYVVSENDMQDFIGSLGILDVDAAAACLQLVADLTADADSLDQAAIQRIRELISENKNEHYRRIMRALVAATQQGQAGIKSAYLTATRLVEMSFRWTIEYYEVLGLFRDRLRRGQQTGKGKNRASTLSQSIAG